MSECTNRNHIVYPDDNILAPCGGLLLNKDTFKLEKDSEGRDILVSTGGAELRPATRTELGSVIIGYGVDVTEEGVISVIVPRLVGTVTNGGVFPTTRPDGTPLVPGDYVQPAPDATYPFTVGTVTFESPSDQAAYIDGVWVYRKAINPKTNEVDLAVPTDESFDTLRTTQAETNKDLIYEIKNAIVYAEDLDALPSSRITRRLYFQTEDTAARKRGLYWRNTIDETWELFNQESANVTLSYPDDESWEEIRTNQADTNKDIMWNLRNVILEYSDLSVVPADKLYRRLYRQLNNTVDRFAGLYYYDFNTSAWVALDGDTARVTLNDPTGVEKWENLDNKTQLQLNATILDQHRNNIIEYNDLNDVPSDRLYRRLYHQMTDTTDRKAGIYWYDFENDVWVALEQNTERIALTDPGDTEKFESELATQKDFNELSVYEWKNQIREYNDLDTVEADRRYKRVYRQTVDTVVRPAGLYYYDFAINKWIAFDGNTERTPLTDPTGTEKFEVERENQKEWNEDVINDLKAFIRYYPVLDTVEADKRYKRIYKQTEDTSSRKAGYYFWDVTEGAWIPCDGDTLRVALNDPDGVELFEEELETQRDFNELTIYELKNFIRESEDLDTIPLGKRYKRLYRQTADNAARLKGLYWWDSVTNTWVSIDPDTHRVSLTDKTTEKWEIERDFQDELNKDFAEEFAKIIIEYDDLADVPSNKLYRRIYRQLEDSTDRKAGLYYWDFADTDPAWQPLGGDTESTRLTDVELESMSLDDENQKDVNETNKKIISRMLYMPVFSRVEPWLYEADYKNAQVDEVFARDYINSHDGKLSELGACTAVYNNGYFAKSFDWTYDYNSSIAVKILGGFYDVMGTTSGINALSKDYCEHLLADKTEWNDVLRALPYYLNEGQNNAGVFSGINIVPANEILEGSPTIPTTGTNPTVSTRTSALMIPSLILQNCGSASEAKTYINNLNIYCPDGSEVHLMIGDGSGTLWLLEFINNGVAWTDMTASNKAPYMTNYYQTYATYGADKKLVDHNHIGEHPNGVHRGDLVAENLSSIVSVDSALDFLQTTVKYTNTYVDSTDWIDEFCSNTPEFGDLTIAMADTNPSAFTDIITWAQNQYAMRSRDTGTTWQTVFSAVNDIGAKKMYVVVQEQGVAAQYMFELDDTPAEECRHIVVDELPDVGNERDVWLVRGDIKKSTCTAFEDTGVSSSWFVNFYHNAWEGSGRQVDSITTTDDIVLNFDIWSGGSSVGHVDVPMGLLNIKNIHDISNIAPLIQNEQGWAMETFLMCDDSKEYPQRCTLNLDDGVERSSTSYIKLKDEYKALLTNVNIADNAFTFNGIIYNMNLNSNWAIMIANDLFNPIMAEIESKFEVTTNPDEAFIEIYPNKYISESAPVAATVYDILADSSLAQYAVYRDDKWLISNKIDMDSVVTSTSTNAVTSKGIYEFVNERSGGYIIDCEPKYDFSFNMTFEQFVDAKSHIDSGGNVFIRTPQNMFSIVQASSSDGRNNLYVLNLNYNRWVITVTNSEGAEDVHVWETLLQPQTRIEDISLSNIEYEKVRSLYDGVNQSDLSFARIIAEGLGYDQACVVSDIGSRGNKLWVDVVGSKAIDAEYDETKPVLYRIFANTDTYETSYEEFSLYSNVLVDSVFPESPRVNDVFIYYREEI